MVKQVVDGRMHDLDQRIRPQPERQHRDREDREEQEFTLVDIGERTHVVVGDITEDHALDHPQGIGRTENQGRGGEEGNPEIRLETGEDDESRAEAGKTISDDQAAELKAELEATETDVKRFCAAFNIDDADQLKASDFPKAMSMLARKRTA